MKTYIECYYEDGKQILGNGDGQAVITAKLYRRTNSYKRIVDIVKNGQKWRNPDGTTFMNRKVAFAKIVTETGTILETIRR